MSTALARSAHGEHITQISLKFLDFGDQVLRESLDFLDNLENIEDDQEIISVRKAAQRWGIYAWVIQCACDAEIWKRIQRFKSAPGKSDKNKIGLTHAVEKRAEELGCNPNTIRNNARIYRVFGERLNGTIQLLPEKEFYTAALKGNKDPEKANAVLDNFLSQKALNSNFEPADAKRFLRSNKKENIVAVEELPSSDLTLRAHIEKIINEIRNFKRTCPDKGFSRRYYDDWIDQLETHLHDMLVLDPKEKIINAWIQGEHTTSHISKRTGIGTEVVVRIMSENGFEQIDQRGETEVARGGHTKLWHRVGDPTGDKYIHSTANVKFFGDDEDNAEEF